MRNSCSASLPPSAFRRVAVFIEASADDSAALAILPAADLLAQTVAERIRGSLGAGEGELPAADSVVRSEFAWGRIILTARPDGSFTWMIPRESAEAAASEKSALVMVQNALSELSQSGERLVWPEKNTRDSLRFSLILDRPRVGKDMKVMPIKARLAIPLFTLAVLWEKPVELTRKPRVEYPLRSMDGGASGGVKIEYVVDSLGRIKPGSIAEVWPEGIPKPASYLGDYYKAFLKAVMRGMPTAEFSPAMIGGCKVSQRVIQVFNFVQDEEPRR
jgi:hypothetical protein